ncbi:ABC transporter permease [Kutzneria sp. CA-103260]|uniref:ABC transporter permease n=1 Tax=Kutzneria sp. CA-103260 TaxID=2802641 RepID=UPI001BA55731|nr:ABC transporter permease [Kutzneria sp. CA-103260]QUQ72328.1 ABC transporter permease [Kutzneria sp. CA-103260]
MTAGWPHDFALGVRLAVGGGRTSWTRLALGTVGIGLATALLLLFASFGNVMARMDARVNAGLTDTTVISGVSPTQYLSADITYRGVPLTGAYLHGTGPNSPVPPGIGALPGPNEAVLSPALADLLRSDAGLRSRFPQQVVGTIGVAGLRGPADLAFYVGVGPLPTSGAEATNASDVYAFGAPPGQHSTDPTLLVVAAVGGVALLIPILIFVAVSSRIAGAQRDRRLAALRLAGAGDRQVRRIAAAESLVSAATGLVLGALVFLGLRQLAPRFDMLGWSFFTEDIVPDPLLTALIVLLVPTLAVGTALFALRGVIIEPLGVVREARPVRRRLWWRVAPIALGLVLLLVVQPGHGVATGWWIAIVVIGATSLMVGVPAILPWLLERLVDRIRGGAPSWQLAIRRLQLDSGTPARVVAGVAVVLASAVTMQLMLASATNRYDLSTVASGEEWVSVFSTAAAAGQVTADLAKVPAAKRVDQVQQVDADHQHTVSTASCATITRTLPVSHCVDGDSFLVNVAGTTDPANPGDIWQLTGRHRGSEKIAYTVPNLTPVTTPMRVPPGPYIGAGVVLTPAAAAQTTLPVDRQALTYVLTDAAQADAGDQIAAALAGLTWQVYVSITGSAALSAGQDTFVVVRGALLVASLFTLLLAGISMLVLALEQIRERRRPLAMLAAAGVPRSALARSLLWQTAVPVVLAVVVAVGIGVGLAGLVLRTAGLTLRIDWSMIGAFAGATVVLVLLVTAMTLPTLRGVTRMSSLRTE